MRLYKNNKREPYQGLTRKCDYCSERFTVNHGLERYCREKNGIPNFCKSEQKKLYDENPLNEHFWFYEETEWAWRMHLKNIPQFITEGAYYKHKVGGSMNPGKTAFHVAKSSTATHFICMKSHTLALIAPLIIYHHLRLLVFETLRLRKPVVIKRFAEGIASFLSDIHLYAEDRHNVQKSRMFGDLYIIKKMISGTGYVRYMEKKFKGSYA